MAVVAIPRRYEMGGGLTGCLRPSVADRASGGCIGMIERRRLPPRRSVTCIAFSRHRQMRSGLTRGLGAVVACAAGTKNLRVIDSCRGLERRRVVTTGAGRRGGDMRRGLAFGCSSVVAGDAG